MKSKVAERIESKTPEKVKAAARNKNTFTCLKCSEIKNVSGKQIAEHLLTAHKIDIAKVKCTTQMLSHMDGDTWFSSNYSYTFPGEITIMQYCYNVRSKNDPMRY